MSAYPPSEPLPASAEGMQPQIYKINFILTNPNSFLFSCSLVVSTTFVSSNPAATDKIDTPQ